MVLWNLDCIRKEKSSLFTYRIIEVLHVIIQNVCTAVFQLFWYDSFLQDNSGIIVSYAPLYSKYSPSLKFSLNNHIRHVHEQREDQ